jgi:hypothetical protein
MRRLFLTIVGIMFCVGCSGNQVTLTNDSYTRVTLHFRGEQYALVPGEVRDLTGIPNGAFDFSTMYVKPDEVLSEHITATGDLSGQMSFFNWNTCIDLRYISVLEPAITRDSSCVKDSSVSPARTVCTVTTDTVWNYQIGASASTSKPSATSN